MRLKVLIDLLLCLEISFNEETCSSLINPRHKLFHWLFLQCPQYMVMAEEVLFVRSRDAVLLLFIPREVNLAVFSLLRSSSSHRPCSPAFCKMTKRNETLKFLETLDLINNSCSTQCIFTWTKGNVPKLNIKLLWRTVGEKVSISNGFSVVGKWVKIYPKLCTRIVYKPLSRFTLTQSQWESEFLLMVTAYLWKYIIAITKSPHDDDVAFTFAFPGINKP